MLEKFVAVLLGCKKNSYYGGRQKWFQLRSNLIYFDLVFLFLNLKYIGLETVTLLSHVLL